MKIALATPPIPKSLQDGLEMLEELVKIASNQAAEIICFPESYLPGYPGMGYSTKDRTEEALQNALNRVCEFAKHYSIAVIVPMDWHSAAGLLNVAVVVSAEGEVIGYQTKNQLDPSEDDLWIPGTERRLFEVNGVTFGISICHEGFRYPESVRWAAQNGAKIVFHPHFTGNDDSGNELKEWGSIENPYYEKAMMMRSIENTIYFASVNYASKYTESASSVINPDGTCLDYQKYGQSGVLLADIDPDKATGLLARRFKNALYCDKKKKSV